jgi:hypothetical protein
MCADAAATDSGGEGSNIAVVTGSTSDVVTPTLQSNDAERGDSGSDISSESSDSVAASDINSSTRGVKSAGVESANDASADDVNDRSKDVSRSNEIRDDDDDDKDDASNATTSKGKTGLSVSAIRRFVYKTNLH